jgi:hypothetical protein
MRPLRTVPSVLVLSSALSFALAPTPARAEFTWVAPSGDPSSAARQEAKALYVAGNRAVEQGRWSDALVDFEKAYALSGVPAALFNVATTLRALGRHVESRDAFAQLLASHGDKLDPDVKSEAEARYAEEKARVASLVVADLPAKSDALKIFLDGKSQKDGGARPLSLEVDAGKHALRVERERSKPFAWEGSLADGEAKLVPVKLVPEDKPAGAAPPSSPDRPKEGGSIWSSPVFWTVVGVVVVGGAVGGYYYDKSQQLEPGAGVRVKP